MRPPRHDYQSTLVCPLVNGLTAWERLKLRHDSEIIQAEMEKSGEASQVFGRPLLGVSNPDEQIAFGKTIADYN